MSECLESKGAIATNTKPLNREEVLRLRAERKAAKYRKKAEEWEAKYKELKATLRGLPGLYRDLAKWDGDNNARRRLRELEAMVPALLRENDRLKMVIQSDREARKQ